MLWLDSWKGSNRRGKPSRRTYNAIKLQRIRVSGMGFIGLVMSFTKQGATATLTEALDIVKYPLAIAANTSQIGNLIEATTNVPPRLHRRESGR
jgi:hypothetical protein